MKQFKHCYSILLCLFCVACGGKKDDVIKPGEQAGPRPPQRVDAVVVVPQKITEDIQIPGSLLASETTEIHPEVSGRLTMLNVREGENVAKGSVIAKLYDADLQAQLKKLQAQLSIGNQTSTRLEQLLKIQGISRQDYDLAVLSSNNIKADIDIVRTDIGRTVIRAPFSGKLGLKAVSIGAYVTPQTIITVIRKTSDLRLDFTIPEKYISEAKEGNNVFFTVEGSQSRYTAKILATESGISENTRSLNVRATVTSKDAALTPGAFAKVLLNFAPDYTALMVPSQSVIPQARGKKLILFKQGVAKFVDITTGVRDSANVQILSGINAGDTVVTTGLMSLKPEAKIAMNKIIKASTSPAEIPQ
ncbi:MAG: efflux RND transporter periplasmic adaptor subunit [Ginsengibacter sp.]